jgi:hypothetical protein
MVSMMDTISIRLAAIFFFGVVGATISRFKREKEKISIMDYGYELLK